MSKALTRGDDLSPSHVRKQYDGNGQPGDTVMAKLIYSMMASLDGYVNDRQGRFDWGQAQDVDYLVHSNEQAKQIGTEIYGRQMYELMVYWESQDPQGDDPDNEFARLWQAKDKLVVSKSLREVRSKRTQFIPELDAAALKQLKLSAEKDLCIAGPTLASSFLAQGLVDEVAITYAPVAVGGGTPLFKNLPSDIRFQLLEQRTYRSGAVFVRYRVNA
ncbi:dihydrofolate reductase family protein [Corallococcus sp. CA053C]|uniref:dihydrofolate reductase family protein n=1 Tax=Corallococcus sp. CA053C TaxID=2316732 RepID=UPI0013154451|nr:dihydrofolate reductase family protein [Corallococcus sp. CA053C]